MVAYCSHGVLSGGAVPGSRPRSSSDLVITDSIAAYEAAEDSTRSGCSHRAAARRGDSPDRRRKLGVESLRLFLLLRASLGRRADLPDSGETETAPATRAAVAVLNVRPSGGKETKCPKKTKSCVEEALQAHRTGISVRGAASAPPNQPQRQISAQNRGTEVLADPTGRVYAMGPRPDIGGSERMATSQRGVTPRAKHKRLLDQARAIWRRKTRSGSPPGRREGGAICLSRPQGEKAQLPRALESSGSTSARA